MSHKSYIDTSENNENLDRQVTCIRSFNHELCLYVQENSVNELVGQNENAAFY